MGIEQDYTELTKKDLEVARAEVSKIDYQNSRRQKLYAWIVLVLILLCNISNQWQRFIIAVAYQIKPVDGIIDPKYQMKYAIPNFTT